MNLIFPPDTSPFVKCADCRAILGRLLGNLGGFLYRRQHDRRWTMDFLSAESRDITGYDPHRFLAKGSIAFANLIARSDWERVNETVRVAILQRRRATVEYLIRTASGALVQVEDRFTPVVNEDGKLLAIEGIIDRSRSDRCIAWSAPRPGEIQLPAPFHSPSLN